MMTSEAAIVIDVPSRAASTTFPDGAPLSVSNDWPAHELADSRVFSFYLQ